jgi:hypothetical protein
VRFSRRQILALCGSLPFVQTLLARVDNTDAEALRNSPFAYISPVKSDKTLSRCQAEVWYVRFEDALFVCSDTVSWRIQAVLQGLDQARLWLGDVGEWEKSDQTYKSLPTFIATAEIASGDELWDNLMGLFGEKYPLEWLLWRRSFRNGLADGSRTMLRYTIM